jgi:hypothetical protein
MLYAALTGSSHMIICSGDFGRCPTEAMRLRFDQEKKESLYSRLLVELSASNGASPTSATTMR